MVYVGVDQHSTQITVHLIREGMNGIERQNRRYPLDSIDRFLDDLNADAAVCVEAGSGAFFFAGLVRATGARVFVVNPMDMRLIWGGVKKTDRVDARKLANALKRHLENDDKDDHFPEVFVPDEKTQELRVLVTHYQYLTTSRNRIRNRIFAVCRQRMIQISRQDLMTSPDEVFANPSFRDSDRFMIRQLLREYELIDADFEATRDRITALGVIRYSQEVQVLMTIHGISVFGSVCIMSDIVDIRRFRTRRHLVSYLRAAPRVDSSNERTHIGGINKRGRRLTFTLLLEASHHLVDGNPLLDRFVARSLGKSRKKIRVAVVGRTIGTIFYMLKNGEASRFPRESSFRRKKRDFERFKNFDFAA